MPRPNPRCLGDTDLDPELIHNAAEQASVAPCLLQRGALVAFAFGESVDDVRHSLQGRLASLDHGLSSFIRVDEAEVVRSVSGQVKIQRTRRLVGGLLAPVNEHSFNEAAYLVRPDRTGGLDHWLHAGHWAPLRVRDATN